MRGTFDGRSGYLFVTKGFAMLWTIAVVILLLWLLGFSLDVAGGLIHLLLIVALIVIVVQFLRGRSGV